MRWITMKWTYIGEKNPCAGECVLDKGIWHGQPAMMTKDKQTEELAVIPSWKGRGMGERKLEGERRQRKGT